MASSKSFSRTAPFLRLPTFHGARDEKEKDDIVVVVEEAPATGTEPDGSTAASPVSPTSESGFGSPGTTGGSTTSPSSPGFVPPPPPPPPPPREEKEDRPKDKRISRRKSMMGILTSLFPILTPSNTDPAYSQQSEHEHQQAYLQRKPLPQPAPAGDHRQSAYINNPLGPPATLGWAIIPAYPVYPVAPSQPPPPPPNMQPAHTRNGSPPVLLKKSPQGSPSQSPPRIPAVTTTQVSPESNRRGRGRSASPGPRSPPHKLQTHRLQPQHAAQPVPRGRSSSAQPPSVRLPSTDGPRVVSSPASGALPSINSSDDGDSPTGKSKRRSWFHGGRSRANSDEMGIKSRTGAWVITPDSRTDYNTAMLLNGEKVPELWHENGSVCIFLFPKETGRGPSFKVPDRVFGSSRKLNALLLSETIGPDNRGSLLTADAAARCSPRPPPGEHWLYLPLERTDLEGLVATRNLFAFLTGQPLLGTKAAPNLFSALIQVSHLLELFDFISYDGSSFGDEVDTAFDTLIDQFALADVRTSREKTIEALLLAEKMRSWNLYNEAFSHAVGKYDDLIDIDLPIYNRISVSTRNRLERAHLDLLNRQQNVNLRLESFEFPSLFAGVASSTSQYKTVHFKEWRNHFNKMRQFTLGYFKDSFGNWPPKAKSKKNHFSRSGLNRQALRILYWDLCSLYDLLVDREAPTTRAIDDQLSEDETDTTTNPSISALRKMLTEFDHSSPPVLPPIPFDIPKLPSMTAVFPKYNDLPSKKQGKYDKTLQANELLLVLLKARNIDTDSLNRPFLNAFKEFELKEAKSVSPHDLADMRIGIWLFLYTVLQSLPMLVIDAPGLKYTDGVEYFLCQAPQGNAPWNEEAGEVRKMWYRTGAGGGLVELSADVVLFSVEGIYTRSHCWEAAKAWQGGPSSALDKGLGLETPARSLGPSPLEPPRAVFQDMDPVSNPVSGTGASSPSASSPTGSPLLRPRSAAAGRAQHAYRMSVNLGLEPLALGDVVPDAGNRASRVMSGGHGSRQSSVSGFEGGNVNSPLHPRQGGRSTSVVDTPSDGGSTFDDILKGMGKDDGKKKKRGFF